MTYAPALNCIKYSVGIDQTYATAVILLLLVIIVNFVSGLVAKRLGSESNSE